MAHVKISSKQGVGHIEVDGVDLSMAVLRAGFRVEFDTAGDFGHPEVHMIVAAETLEMDLPDAVVKPLRAPLLAGVGDDE